MANEFIARNGFRSQNNSDITGSLNVTAGITGSFTGSLTGIATSASFASTASYVATAQTSSATTLTSSYVGFGNGSNLMTGSSNFYYQDQTSYKRLYITSPNGSSNSVSIYCDNNTPLIQGYSNFVVDSAYGELFLISTSGTGINMYVGSGTNTFAARLEKNNGLKLGGYNSFTTANAANYFTVDGGNSMFGTNVATSARVEIRGSGATSATTSFLVRNSTPSTLFQITDDGRTEVTGSLGVTGGITGSLLGTAATSSVTILTSSYIGFGNGSNLMTGSSKFYYEDQTSYKRLFMLSPNGSSNYIYNYVDNSAALLEGYNTLVINSAYGELYLRSDYGTAINMYAGAGVSTFAARLERNNGLKLGGGGSFNTANAANYLTVDGGNSMFGTNSATSARVEIRGSGTTSATTTFLVRNSTPTTILEIKDDQSIGFFGVTPSTRPTTGITGAATGGGGGVPIDDATTYGGYTMGQVVAALQQLGLLT